MLMDKAYGCLVAGVIGDSMGTPTENLEPEAIAERFGWVSDFKGDGTDDTVLRDLLCDALIKTEGYAHADDWAIVWKEQRNAIFGPKQSKFFISVIHTVRKLDHTSPRMACIGNLPSSSSAMGIAPVGIVNAGHPKAASAQAQELGSLIHTGDMAFCQDGAAAIASAVAAAFIPSTTIDAILDAATAHLKPISGKEMHDLIADALKLARETGDYDAFRTEYHNRFRRAIACDSRETVPAALSLCLLAQGNVEKAVTFAANFGRDTDTIAAMAGAICGAYQGASSIPTEWLQKIEQETSRNQKDLAKALIGVAKKKARRETAAWAMLNHA